jgi:ceramide glucosyltransferase
MTHGWAQAVEVVTTVLAVAGMGYFVAAWLAAQIFLAGRRRAFAASAEPGGSPGVSVLKSLKGLDPGMLEALRSHCRQSYAGEYELLFGASSLDDPAAEAVRQLQQEFPERAIRLMECPLRLGSNGKVSTLVQMAPQARYDTLLINDSDITVGPRYLERVMAAARPVSAGPGARPVGLVTALYRGRAHGTLPSLLEALGIATDFQPSVLLARWLEGGLRYGLGSTLAVSREALQKIGGLEVLLDQLADDYELGARVYAAGYGVALSHEVVETSVPAYRWRGFVDHQLRWYRTVRDARPWGYVGLVFTYGLGWALLNVVASGISLLSLWLLAMSFFLRLALAMTVGAGVLGDRQVLPSLGLLPLRDLVAMGLWVAGFAGNTIVWRGERFVVSGGRLTPAEPAQDSRVTRQV